MHELDVSRFELPPVSDWFSGDTRALGFVVTHSDGTPIDISDAVVEWRLFRRSYETGDDAAMLTGDDEAVEIVTDNRVDSENGEFEVRVDPAATAATWGEAFHRPVVEQSDGTRASWRGRVVLEA